MPSSQDVRAEADKGIAEAWAEWGASLSDDDSEFLAEVGITGPPKDGQQISGQRFSVTDSVSIPAPETKQATNSREAEAMLAILKRINRRGNVKANVLAALSALGDYELAEKTCQELGDICGFSRQRFNYLRQEFIDVFGLSPAPGGSVNYHGPKKPNPHRWHFENHFDRLRLWINRRRKECPVSKWPAPVRRNLKNELTWLAGIIKELDLD